MKLSPAHAQSAMWGPKLLLKSTCPISQSHGAIPADLKGASCSAPRWTKLSRAAWSSEGRGTRCGAVGENGALFSSGAVLDLERESGVKQFVNHIEGGGQVKASVSTSGDRVLVRLDAKLANPKSEAPLHLHWGIHRSDRSSWFLLEPGQAPPGTELVQGDEEAMRTPFQGSSSALKTLSIELPSALAPLSLDFVLYQPPGKSGQPERYIGGTQARNFSVPVGMDVGSPSPLGATRQQDGSVNFALFSRHAEGVVLCLYEEDAIEPSLEIDLEPASHRTGDVWHVRLADTQGLCKYGYRCKGDVSWDAGHRFHYRNVLLDPYATIIAAPAPGQESAESQAAALGLIPPERALPFDWEDDYCLGTPAEELVVYRLNVAAFTADAASGVAESEQGTFVGVARKADHFVSLGVSAVLLQPVAAFDANQGSYFPVNFFSPHPAYGTDGDGQSASVGLKQMVKELHQRGIEVLLEVVVTNTAEMSDQDPLNISFRGIDNKMYYLTDEFGQQVVPDFGAPNAFNCNNPVAHSLIVDALSHWVTEYHIDGFSFVNSKALSMGPHGQPLSRPLLLEALSFEPVLAGAKLIADPCSPTTGLCEVSALPHWSRWMEMNERFRMDVRRFLIGQPGQLSNMATRLTGSGDLFSAGRGPAYSFNLITSFTGLTLADLVSYTVDSESSWGFGENGPSQDPMVSSTRIRQMRNFLCASFISLGVPVILMGDEYGNTKEGSLAQPDCDAVFSWQSLQTDLGQQTMRLILSLSWIRRKLSPLLQRKDYFFAGDVTWHGMWAGSQPQWDDPNSAFLAYCIHSEGILASLPSPPKHPVGDVYVAFNAQQQAVDVELPAPPAGSTWACLVNTSLDSPDEISVRGVPLDTRTYILAPFSMIVLESQKSPSPTPNDNV